MKKITLILTLLFVVAISQAQTTATKEKMKAIIVCDGNSLTYGSQSSNPAAKSYPAVLQTLLPLHTNGTIVNIKVLVDKLLLK